MATLVATFFLIGVGSFVRVTGAGLGCPDWPKCWGCWVPPSEVSAIPQQQDRDGNPYYLDKKGRKQYLSELNNTKMWTEYVNRLVGVTIGILVLATFFKSFRYRKSFPAVFWGSFAAFVLVVVNGWLGKNVVESELNPDIISLHLGLAIAQVMALMWVLHITQENPHGKDVAPVIRNLAMGLFLVTLVQMLLGTQVRGIIDIHLLEGTLPRDHWIASMNQQDYIHRSFSWIVGILSILLLRKTRSPETPASLRSVCNWIMVLVVAEVLIGVSMAYNGVPLPSQILHLLASTGLVSLQFLLILHCFPQGSRAPTLSPD